MHLASALAGRERSKMGAAFSKPVVSCDRRAQPAVVSRSHTDRLELPGRRASDLLCDVTAFAVRAAPQKDANEV